jgi:hypothetical protein
MREEDGLMRWVRIRCGFALPSRRKVAHHRRRCALAALVAVAVMSPSVGSIEAGASPPQAAADPKVISDWNAIAFDTIIVDAGKANAEAFMWFAFEQTAVYNAVVGITRRYDLYNWNTRGPSGASPQAAAAVAAHDVLLEYFPASQGRLDAGLAASLAEVPDGPAKAQGMQYGARAADRLVELRSGDGRFAPITFDVPPAPGVWRPTPPGFVPFFDPWLARLRPLTLESPSQFRPGPPPALTSPAYTADFNEVKDVGSATSTTRTPEQTATALFIAGSTFPLVSSSLRDLAARYELDISDSARLFAAVSMSAADAVITAWDSKLKFGYWRPVTAIQLADTDGNPGTLADPGWLPLLVTPPYPEYTSGLTSIMGAVTHALSRTLGLGGGRIDVNITVAGTTRHYEFASQLNRDAVDARVWSGIHFRTADVVGIETGTQVGDWALDNYFQPRGRR